MDVAVIGTSRKENEKRVAIHPEHIKTIPEQIRRHLFFEKGYGIPFSVPDDRIAALTGNEPLDRAVLLKNFSGIIIPKPVEEDLKEMREGAVVWGWIHSVQQSSIAQIAIDRKLTLIVWERMYDQDGRGKIHVFQKNNEMAGYCGVQHALQLRGIDGNFGSSRKAAVLSFGSVGRGAVYALENHGFHDITVFTRRPTHKVSDRLPGVRFRRMYQTEDGDFRVEYPDGNSKPLIDELTEADIIANGILQNPNRPAVFIRDSDLVRFKKECLIVDVSCDRGMGFSFAFPADFSHPLCQIKNILYYSVDHTPSLLWDSASWEISSSLMPYLACFVERKDNPVLDGAIDIKDGIIVNPDILAFQHRSPAHPYQPESMLAQHKIRSRSI